MKIKRVVLIGFRATGKSTVGRLLAQRLSWDFVDLDDYLKEKLGKSIREVVEEAGWGVFREAERKALQEMRGRKKLVLAVGGGAVMHREEMESLAQGSLVVWLKASAETIVRRLEADPRTGDQRPSLTGKPLKEEVQELLRTRTPLYDSLAHLELSSDALSPQELVEVLLAHPFLHP